MASAAIAGGPSKSFSYDSIGNILTKSDVGTYSYPTVGSAHPHAVSSIAGTVNAAYSYDANGNLTAGAGRSVSWTSFNMPATIQRGTNVLGYAYDTEHNRIKQADTSTTTLFFNDPASGLTVEKVVGSGGAVTWNNYVYVDGAIAVAFYEQPAGTSQWRYFHQDQLGSIEVITDQTGTVVERQGYDSWGKRRYPGGADDPTEAITSLTDRSYTGHAYLQEVGLIHMNGRVYDPVLGRFMSADPNVQSPTHTQSFNRYSYVMNNPLNATDPTGFQSETEGIGSYSDFAFSFDLGPSLLDFSSYYQPLAQRSILFIRNPAITPGGDVISSKATSSGFFGFLFDDGFGDRMMEMPDYNYKVQLEENRLVAAPFKYVINGIGEHIESMLDKAGNPDHRIPPEQAKENAINSLSMLLGGIAAGRGARNLDETGNSASNVPNAPKLTEPGKYAGESIPARTNQRSFTTEERNQINKIGSETGCHSCGTRDPGTKSGNFVPDHQPPSALNPAGGPQQLYPHCINCSREQGLSIARQLRDGIP